MEIEPPHLRPGQFWYKTVDIAGPPLVIEIMAVDAISYQYREWLPTVQGMRHAVGRMVEWEAPFIDAGSEEWKISPHTDNGQLTHRLLMGDRKGFGRRRWCRMIQGAYRTICPAAPLCIDTQQIEDAIMMQLHMLQNQLQRLGPYTMYTDGGWEYGGDGMDAPFHPYTDSPSHKGGGSIIFITTDLARIRSNFHGSEDQTNKTIDHVAIRFEHGEEVGRGPNPQELLALLGALAVSTRLSTRPLMDKRIGSNCKSLVDYVNKYRHARMRNEVGKLTAR